MQTYIRDHFGWRGIVHTAVEAATTVNITKDADADVAISIIMTVNTGYECEIDWGDGNTDTVVGSGLVVTSTNTYGDTNSYSITISGDLTQVTYFKSESEPISCDLSEFAKFSNIEKLRISSTNITGSVSELSDLTTLTNIYLNNLSITGSISEFSGMTGMTDLRFSNTSLTGDLSSLSSMTSMQFFFCNDVSTITGGIDDLSGWTALRYLYGYTSSLAGDLSDASAWSSIQYLYITNSSVTGDASDLSGLTTLRYINIANLAGITGDAADLSPLTNATNFYCNGTGIDTYTQGTLPDWDNCHIRFQDCGWSQQEVDDFLVDLNTASSASTKLLNLSGTNAAPSATGLTAKTALEGKGWTVTVST